ncbi:hypothetical protein PMAYCL1PPCAC_25911, partial [Pristionchus mayeri]
RSKLKNLNEWKIWYKNNRASFGPNVRMPPATLHSDSMNVHILPHEPMFDPNHGCYRSVSEPNHMAHQPMFDPNPMGQWRPHFYGAPPPSFHFQAMPNQPRPPSQFDNRKGF